MHEDTDYNEVSQRAIVNRLPWQNSTMSKRFAKSKN